MQSNKRPLTAVMTLFCLIVAQAAADPTGLLALVPWSGAAYAPRVLNPHMDATLLSTVLAAVILPNMGAQPTAPPAIAGGFLQTQNGIIADGAGNRAFQNFYFNTDDIRVGLAQTWGELAQLYGDVPVWSGE